MRDMDYEMLFLWADCCFDVPISAMKVCEFNVLYGGIKIEQFGPSCWLII